MREKFILTRPADDAIMGIYYDSVLQVVTMGGPTVFYDLMLETLSVVFGSKTISKVSRDGGRSRFLLEGVSEDRWKHAFEVLRGDWITTPVTSFRRLMS